jgi:hypothetical protein
VANVNGRFEVVSVDDRIPVYKKTLEPIWGFSFNNPWSLILLKAYAKIKGGYHEILNARPFEFTETFSHNIWKYFNIEKDSKRFLKYYYDSKKFKNGKIILKTKKTATVIKEGLTANSASYEVIAIHEANNREEDESIGRFVLTIRSTDLAKYKDEKLNFYCSSGKEYFTEDITLDHDTLIKDTKFMELFASAHITSTRHDDFYSGYKILNIEKFERRAQHF